MHLVKNPNCVKTAPKEVVESYSTQHGHVKIMLDCLGSVKKVPSYMCYKFQLFISKRASTGKKTHEYMINLSSCIGLKAEHMWLPKRYSLPKNSNYQWINGILDINK